MRKEPAVSGLRLKDYVCLLAAAVAAVSVFLPWFKIEAATISESGARLTSYETFKGTFVEGGWVGLSISLFSMVMLFLRVKWCLLAISCNVLVGLGYILGWVDLSKKILTNHSGHEILHVEPQAGLYLFLVSSLLCSMLILRTHYASRGF